MDDYEEYAGNLIMALLFSFISSKSSLSLRRRVYGLNSFFENSTERNREYVKLQLNASTIERHEKTTSNVVDSPNSLLPGKPRAESSSNVVETAVYTVHPNWNAEIVTNSHEAGGATLIKFHCRCSSTCSTPSKSNQELRHILIPFLVEKSEEDEGSDSSNPVLHRNSTESNPCFESESTSVQLLANPTGNEGLESSNPMIRTNLTGSELKSNNVQAEIGSGDTALPNRPESASSRMLRCPKAGISSALSGIKYLKSAANYCHNVYNDLPMVFLIGVILRYTNCNR